jgi:hypothetical protein
VGGDFSPGAGTTVTAPQNGQTFTLFPYADLTSSVAGFYANIPYDPALAGAWTVIANNANTTPATVSLPTNDNAVLFPGAGWNSPLVVPPITNATTDGLSTTPTFSWAQPMFSAPSGGILYSSLTIYDLSIPGGEIVLRQDLKGTNTFTVPSTFNNTSLLPGHEYLVVLNSGVAFASTFTQTENSFNFEPLSGTPAFPGPISLPTEDRTTGVFTFSLTVQNGVPLVLDPPSATGYVFATGSGDPNFRSITLPSLGTGDFKYEIDRWNRNGWELAGYVSALKSFSFGTPGVSQFRVLGIPLDAGLSPSSATAFQTQVTFTADGAFTGTMTPLSPATDIASLAAAVANLKPAAGLAAKMALVQSYFAVPNVRSTCSALSAFSESVRDQTGKYLSAPQAAALLAEARQVKQELSCQRYDD